MKAKPIEEKTYDLVNAECTGGIKVILSPNDQWNVKQLEDGRTVVESHGTSIIYPVGDFENDFCINQLNHN